MTAFLIQIVAPHSAAIEATTDTGALSGEAVRLLEAAFRPGFRYAKAGVMLTDLSPADRQAVMLASRDPVRSAGAMAAMDTINRRFGSGTLRPAASGIGRAWSMRQRNLSPRYTTRIEDILVAQAV